MKSRQLRRHLAIFAFGSPRTPPAQFYPQRAIPFFPNSYRINATSIVIGKPLAEVCELEETALIRISQIHEGSQSRLFVEGTLSDGWVEALEMSWLEAQRQSNGEPLRIDLSGVIYVDDKGRDLLARMLRCGAELRTTGIMNRAVVEEITKEIEGERDGGIQVETTENAGRSEQTKEHQESRN